MEAFERFWNAVRNVHRAPAEGGVITEGGEQDDTLIRGGVEVYRRVDPSEWKIEPEEFKTICEQIEDYCFAPSEAWMELFKVFLSSDKFVGNISRCADLADMGLKEFSKRFNKDKE